MVMEPITIGEQISSARKAKGLTQVALAQALGISNQAVSKWESGLCCPDILLLPALADALDTSIDALFGRQTAGTIVRSLPWEDDGSLRAVCYLGHRLVENTPIRNASVELRFEGTVHHIYSDFSVTCIDSSIDGNVNAGTGVSCGTVSGDVTAGDWVRCTGYIAGNATAGDGLDCGSSIGGNATAGEGIRCGIIYGNAFAGTQIECRSIGGLIVEKP